MSFSISVSTPSILLVMPPGPPWVLGAWWLTGVLGIGSGSFPPVVWMSESRSLGVGGGE